MYRSRLNWQKLFSYAEVICFLSAWGVCLLMAASSERPLDDRAATRNFVITRDLSGIQATLRR
jgi:hypothetical protein